jgi:hypothetical protein
MGSVADSVGAKVVLLFQFCKFFKEKQPKITEKSCFETDLAPK